MQEIFSYLDYRVFLKKRFAHLKKTRRATYRSLSQKAGFASPNFLKLVMEGQRNLTKRSIPKVAQAMGLVEREFEFFEVLVRFNQAKDFTEKDLAYEELKHLRKDLALKRIEHSHLEYLDQWHAVAIRELIELKDFKEDEKWIRKKLGNAVTLHQIRRALKLLQRLGLVVRDGRGKLKGGQPALSAGDEVLGLAAHRFHQTMIEKGKESLTKTKAAYRDISSLTLSISAKDFGKIKNKIQQFRREILALAHHSKQAEVVYQLNIQLFNLSEVPWDASAASS